MKIYVGLDVSLEETSLCVVDSEGQTVRELKVSTEPAAIRAALEGCADRLDRVGVEASSLGIWLYRELQPAGVPIIVVEARHMRVSLSTMRNKTDRNDAHGIAQMMRLGWYRAVHVKNIDMQKMRTLLANRKLLKRKLIDIENHIRGALRAYRLLVGAHFSLTPRRHQSGTSIDSEGRISKQGDVAVREALCEAAASVLLRVRKWSALRAWGLRISKRSSMLCPITAVARKLASILHRMWVSETDFHAGFGAKVTQRLRLKPVQ